VSSERSALPRICWNGSACPDAFRSRAGRDGPVDHVYGLNRDALPPAVGGPEAPDRAARDPAVTGALDGVRVLELTSSIAGSVAGMLLADQGADVLTVRTGGRGPSASHPGLHVWDRNKRAAVLDPAAAGDLDALDPLVEAADIVLVGTTEPAVTYDQLGGRGLSPGANCWVVMPPYLLGHTPWAGESESAGLLFADLGQAWSQASFDDVPVDCVFPLSLHMQGVWAATVAVATLAGVRAGRRVGQTAVVGGAHGAMLTSPGGYSVGRDDPHVHRLGGPGGALPNYRCYRCADGRWLFFGAFTAAFMRRGFAALGAAHVLEDERIGGDTDKVRLPANTAWIRAVLDEQFASLPRDEWLALLEAADVPASAVLSSDDWLDHPQVRAMGLRHEVTNDAGSSIVMPGLLIGLSETPGSLRSPAPMAAAPIGDLAGLWPPRQVAAPASAIGEASGEAELPLSGTRVVDLGTMIAGPYVATLLGELGADVVKVERPPGGDEFRIAHGGRGGAGFSVYNRGQRSMLLDLTDPAGLDAFYSIVRTTDVVVENYRPDVVGRLGVSLSHLAAHQSGVTCVSISAFGDSGPLGRRPGFDPVVGAMSGIMRSQGGADQSDSPVFLTAPVNDVTSAALGAFGACCALFARPTLGRGQQVSVTLCAASTLLQSEPLVRFEGRPAPLTGGRDFAGPGPLTRLYRCSDGWVRIDGRVGGRAAAAATGLIPAELGDADGVGDDLLAEAMAATLFELPVALVLARCRAAGLPAVLARQAPQLVGDEALIAHGVLEVLEADESGPLRVGPGFWVGLPGVERPPPGVSPLLGEHADAILAEAGVLEAGGMAPPLPSLAGAPGAGEGPGASVSEGGAR
jgi:crotonobetainyl-CoA:carnitine CoA-transferase CaiB-like acyl-CoA transferase